jgi:hypothetical protein
MARSSRLAVSVGAALAVLALGARGASAQDSQYWNLQYGPVGQLLGGQVVGSTRDLSATYYNPGGLALAKNSAFLLSVQGFQSQTVSLEPLDDSPFPATSQSSFQVFPGFVAAAFPESWFGERTRLAFSLLTRQQQNLRIDERVAGFTLPPAIQAVSPGRTGSFGLERLFDERMRETWGGLTLSHRLSDSVGVGGTLFGVHRGQRTRWEENLQLAYADGGGVSGLIIDDFNYAHWRLLTKVGVAWEGEATRLGLAVTSPSLAVTGSGKAGFTRSAAGARVVTGGAEGATLINGLDEDLAATYKSGWAVAGGGAWRRRSLQIHASAEWFAAVDRFTVLAGEADPSLGTPITLFQDLGSLVNAGIGAEYWLGGVSANRGPEAGGTALYGAFATDFNASPGVIPGEAASSNQDWYHVTVGTAFGVGRSRFSLGISHAFGSKERDISFRGVPETLPVLAEARRVGVRSRRWVFVLGYLFGRR